MKDTGQGNPGGVRRKVYHCKNCGRIQSYTNFECEGCGIDLGLYGDVRFIEDPQADRPRRDIAEERRREEERKRREKEEARRKAEEEKERLYQEKLRQQEDARRREEEESRLAEQKRQEQLRAEEEARKKAEQERVLAEQRRKEQLQAQEAARKKADEERRLAEEAARKIADEERRLAEQKHLAQQRAAEEAKKKADEERRLAAERKRQEQLQAEEAARRQKKAQEQADAKKRSEEAEKRRLERERRSKQNEAQEKKPGTGKDVAARGGTKIFHTLGVIGGIGVVLLVLLIIIGLNSRSCGDNLTWSFDKETGTLTIEGTGEMYSYTSAPEAGVGAIMIPSLDEPPWMEKHGQEILSVVIGEEVTSVGSCAFAGCQKLENVYFGSKVERIDQFAFYNTAMKGVLIPESVAEIGLNAFANIEKLRNVYFNGDPKLKTDVFTWEERLILIANDESGVDEYAKQRDLIFVNGTDIWMEEEIVGQEDVYKRINSFFGGQSDDGNIQWKINISDRTMTLTGSGPIEDFNGKWMLDNEENMESWVEGRNFPYWTDYTRVIEELVIEDGITRIGDSAFEQCGNMKKVTLPSSLEYIGFQSFLCAGITRIDIPEGVTEIRDHAFNFCEKMQFAVLPESLEVLQNGTFNMCNILSILTIGENTRVEERTGENGCYSVFSNDDNPNGRPAHLTIQGKIGSDAQRFAKEEGFQFFKTGLKTGLEVGDKCGDNVRWKFVGDERTLYIEGYGDTWSYHISQEDIDTWAGDLQRRNQSREGDPEFLEYAKYIEHIVVKKGVTTLGHNLFSWHDNPQLVNLKTVDFGSVRHIQANLKCTKLESVELPDTVTGIDGCALADNKYLKTVVIRNGSEWIGTGLLYNCPNLIRVELHGRENIDDYNNGDLFNVPGDLPDWTPSKYLRLYVKRDSDGERMAKEKGIPHSYLDER